MTLAAGVRAMQYKAAGLLSLEESMGADDRSDDRVAKRDGSFACVLLSNQQFHHNRQSAASLATAHLAERSIGWRLVQQRGLALRRMLIDQYTSFEIRDDFLRRCTTIRWIACVSLRSLCLSRTASDIVSIRPLVCLTELRPV